MRRLSPISVVAIVVFVLSGVLYAQSAGHSVFQVSTYQALKQGIFDNETTFGELSKEGDFGLGTLNGLDGEMVALNGEFFQIKADGKVYSIPDNARTPFAVVTFFVPDKRVSLSQVNNMKELQNALDRDTSKRGQHTCHKGQCNLLAHHGQERAQAGKAVSGTGGSPQASNRIRVEECSRHAGGLQISHVHGWCVRSRRSFTLYCRGQEKRRSCHGLQRG